MKRAVIVHCWGGSSNYCWYPSVKTALEENGFKVFVPDMPDSEYPNLATWLPTLEKVIGNPDDELFLIGHSAGCITIMRYLESLESGEKIGGVVFVAGFTDNLGFEELKSFFKSEIDFEKIKLHCKVLTAIYSDDDPYVPIKYSTILHEKLGAKLIEKQSMGHFSGPVDQTKSITALPDVVLEIMEMV